MAEEEDFMDADELREAKRKQRGAARRRSLAQALKRGAGDLGRVAGGIYDVATAPLRGTAALAGAATAVPLRQAGAGLRAVREEVLPAGTLTAVKRQLGFDPVPPSTGLANIRGDAATPEATPAPTEATAAPLATEPTSPPATGLSGLGQQATQQPLPVQQAPVATAPPMATAPVAPVAEQEVAAQPAVSPDAQEAADERARNLQLREQGGRVWNARTGQFDIVGTAQAKAAGALRGSSIVNGQLFSPTAPATSMADFLAQKTATNAVMRSGAGSTHQEQARGLAAQRQAQARVESQERRIAGDIAVAQKEAKGLAGQRAGASAAEEAKMVSREGISAADRASREQIAADKLTYETKQGIESYDDEVALQTDAINKLTKDDFPTGATSWTDWSQKVKKGSRIVISKSSRSPVVLSKSEYEAFQKETPKDTPYMPATPEAEKAFEAKMAELAGGTPATDGAPSVGTVRKGYRFKGGDPGSAGSWEKV